jgi:hypothetical protein
MAAWSSSSSLCCCAPSRGGSMDAAAREGTQG